MIKLSELVFTICIRGKVDAKKFNDLLCRIADSDNDALREIHDEYSRGIYRVGAMYCKDIHYANDIVNLVLTAIWQNADRYIGMKIHSPDNWVFEISKNKALDYLKKACNQKNKHKEYNDLTERETLDYLSINKGFTEIEFESIINSLSDHEKLIVRKKILYRFTHNEIAEELGIPLGTVLWQYHNALKKLKKDLDSTE